ncbi:MAG: cell envelope integrity protein CreD, partial [Proteobacteria bacterium]
LVQDSRGISTLPALTWKDGRLEVKAGPGDLKMGMNGGFHADLPLDVLKGGVFSFHSAFRLRGMQSFGWLPVGENTKVSLKSDWPHPSFQGRSLPISHEIAQNGFEAVWESNYFGSNEIPLLETAASPMNYQDLDTKVRFFQPVDIYVQSERAVKYGFLFIGLTFAAFLGFEAIQKLSIHPVQYGFVGAAIVVFYILLLALSEHVLFVWAYVCASLASASLLAFYVRYVLQSWARSLIFALSLLVLDLIVYGILQSEDFALLYGSLLLFSLLALAMIATRRVNWHGLKSEA